MKLFWPVLFACALSSQSSALDGPTVKCGHRTYILAGIQPDDPMLVVVDRDEMVGATAGGIQLPWACVWKYPKTRNGDKFYLRFQSYGASAMYGDRHGNTVLSGVRVSLSRHKCRHSGMAEGPTSPAP